MKKAIKIALALIIAGLIVAVATVLVSGRIPTSPFRTEYSSGGWMEERDDIQSIVIESTVCDIRVELAEDGVFRVSYNVPEGMWYNVYTDNGYLTVTSCDNRNWIQSITSIGDDNTYVTVYLPRGEYERLAVESVSGDISVSGELSFSSASAHSTSGDIYLSLGEYEQNEVKLSTTSGDIRLRGTEGAVLEATSTSGEIELSGCEFGITSMRTASGDIDIGHCELTELAVSTASGDIELERLYSDKLKLETASGDVEGTLDPDCTAAEHLRGGDNSYCSIKTASGEIEIRVSRN